MNTKKYETSILKFRNEIKYLGQSQRRFDEEIKSLISEEKKGNN